MDWYRIPTSHREHFRSALRETAKIAAQVSNSHPLLNLRAAAESLVSSMVEAMGDDLKHPQPVEGDSPDDPGSSETYDMVVNAMRLCRLAKALVDVRKKRLTNAGEELERMLAQPDHFFHSEYVLHIGSRLWHGLDRTIVRFVTTQGPRGLKTPDIEVPALGVAVECRARERGKATNPVSDDFDHAHEKFKDYFTDKQDWLGLLALDLGYCGSPSLPNIGKEGPHLAALGEDPQRSFDDYPSVAGAVISWVSLESESPPEGPQLCPCLISEITFSRRTPARRRRPLLKVFPERPPGMVRVARRTI